ncbi:hypothetical protein AXW83_11350 [Bosea sp. PAMC 26642]|nr:hypothetical protein AXW83_11350 [Bosea sp. PAMC 26642]
MTMEVPFVAWAFSNPGHARPQLAMTDPQRTARGTVGAAFDAARHRLDFDIGSQPSTATPQSSRASLRVQRKTLAASPAGFFVRRLPRVALEEPLSRL